MFATNTENLKYLEYHYQKKHYIFVLFTVSLFMNIKKYLKKNNQLKY